ncbi:MAG: AAA family ATPase [Chitinophagaceae bacterium]
MSQPNSSIQALNEQIVAASAFTKTITDTLAQVLVGQHHMVNSLLVGLLSNGHILLEGAPGLAKTLAIKSLAQAVDAQFSRIQFTPDLLPADVVGTLMYNQARNEFVVRKGPIFANFILADEINRAPAKVQSALLEAMQERQVTIGDTTYLLPTPFLVLATQNPLEQEGTYPLPEAQLDRFLLKVQVGYPSKPEELQILQQQVSATAPPSITPVVKPEAIIEARHLVRQVYMDRKIEQYIVDLTHATRQPETAGMQSFKRLITYGGSPRATISLALAAKAYAFLQQRAFVLPDDVKAIAHDVLRHRIGLSYEAEAESISTNQVITALLQNIQIP